MVTAANLICSPGTQDVVEARDFLLRAQYDRRSSTRKIIDFSLSLFRQIQYSFFVWYQRVFILDAPSLGQSREWNSESQGLVVLLHGLRNSPAAWYSQLMLLKKYDQIDVLAPSIHRRGMCSLEKAAQPLLPTLLEYIEKHPTKPLCLLGVSNGSRVAAWLEIQLRKFAPQTPVKVSTIAGVHFGSSRMNLLEGLGLAKWFYPKELCHELKYGSEKASELLEQLSLPLPENCALRGYEFFATTEDLSVPDLDSSLPLLDKGERYCVIHGQSHDSIVSAVAERQISACIEWLEKFK
jgi:hypothetical protein